jgi:hypothetical protein
MDFLKKMVGFRCLMNRFHVSLGGDGTGGFAEMTLKVDLSMESKMYGFP